MTLPRRWRAGGTVGKIALAAYLRHRLIKRLLGGMLFQEDDSSYLWLYDPIATRPLLKLQSVLLSECTDVNKIFHCLPTFHFMQLCVRKIMPRK